MGNANDLSLSRQVQLATIARIRHTYTDYDQLLRVGSWRDARTAVEHKCLAKLIEWRGEHEQDPEELEEILRETIVIDDETDDDDDEDDDEDDNAAQDQTHNDDSDTSLEIMQQTIAPKDLTVEPNKNSNLRRSGRNHATLQARWNSARSAEYGTRASQPPSAPASRITVDLDVDGKAPRSFQTGGIQYTRINPDSEITFDQLPPGSDHRGYANTANGVGVTRVQPTSHVEQYNSKAWANNGSLPATYPVSGPARQGDTPVVTAMPSIEQPHDAAASHRARPAYNGAPPVIDLITPPRLRPQGYRIEMASNEFSRVDQPRHMYVHGQESDGDVQLMRTRPHTQAPTSGSYYSRPALSRHHSGVETVDLSRPRDYPMPPQERPVYHDQEAAHHTRPPALDRVHRQPVYGQVAYPQPLSRVTRAPATPPRPVHGAPSMVQPVTAFGAPSPQRYVVGRQPTYRLPER